MDHFAIAAVTVVHITIIVGGIVCIVLGYRLFKAAATSPAGDGSFRFKDWGEFKLTQVAPGVFFALFGAAILIYALVNPERLSGAQGTDQPRQQNQAGVISGQPMMTYQSPVVIRKGNPPSKLTPPYHQEESGFNEPPPPQPGLQPQPPHHGGGG